MKMDHGTEQMKLGKKLEVSWMEFGVGGIKLRSHFFFF